MHFNRTLLSLSFVLLLLHPLLAATVLSSLQLQAAAFRGSYDTLIQSFLFLFLH